MPVLTVVTGTRRISAATGEWVRPVCNGDNWTINFGVAGSRANGSVVTVWQRQIAQRSTTGAPGTEQVVTTVLSTDGNFAGPAAADPDYEYDAGCDTGGAFVSGDTPVVILGY